MALLQNINGDWVDVKAVKRFGESGGDGGGNWEDVWPDGYTKDDPPDFNNPNIYSPLAVFNTNSVWTAPESGWYRIICIGKGGANGSSGGTKVDTGTNMGNPSTWTSYGGGGGAGGSGGIAISNLWFEKGEIYSITVGNICAFGTFLQATAGSDGSSGSGGLGWMRPAPGGYGGSGGSASGGNFLNQSGFRGGNGGEGGRSFRWNNGGKSDYVSCGSGTASEDGNSGQPASGATRGGMGGASRYPLINAIKLYHYTYNSPTMNMVDVANKVVVYGTSGGYGGSGIFPGCVLIDIPTKKS